MAVQLNHTIVPSRDKKVSAQFLTDILGLAPPAVVSHFVAVEVANGVTLDYDNRDEVVRSVDTVEATGTSPSQHARQAREKAPPGVAQSQRTGRGG